MSRNSGNLRKYFTGGAAGAAAHRNRFTFGRASMSQGIEIARLSVTAERGAALRYGIAAVVVLLTLGLRMVLSPFVPNDSVFLFFLPPVLISAGIGGLGPALLATILSIAAAVLFVFIDPLSQSKLFLAICFCLY